MAPSAVDSAIKSGQKAWVIVFDIDNFKAINDSNGQAIGDDALREVAGIARDLLRPSVMAATGSVLDELPPGR